MKSLVKLFPFTLLAVFMLMTLVPTSWPSQAAAQQESERSTSDLKRDLRATEQEFKKFNSLLSKLDSAARQSSNVARESAVNNFQDFMGECIGRRESELGKKLTIKQHGEMVKTGTTEVAEVGSPVPGHSSSKGKNLEASSEGDRLRQLSGMKSIYVGAKNNSRPAIERQDGAFERYLETVGKFGQQLQWGINSMAAELEKREGEAAAKEEADLEAEEADLDNQ